MLIGAASLAGRRWGPAVGGRLVGLPLTSAPVTLFVALELGPRFAAGVAGGSLGGTLAQAAFCVAYAALARRRGWGLALVAGAAAFAGAAAALHGLGPSLVALGVAAPVGLVLALCALPRGGPATPRRLPLPAWDLPARMIAATAVVLLLTGAVPVLGPQVTELLSTFPVYAGILAVFAHGTEGPRSAVRVLRGLLAGLFGFAGFFLTVGGLVERAGIAAAFVAALAVTHGGARARGRPGPGAVTPT